MTTGAAQEEVHLRVISYNVWGMPNIISGNKEQRILGVSSLIKRENFDLLLLTELWMRHDHELIRQEVLGSHRSFKKILILSKDSHEVVPFR